MRCDEERLRGRWGGRLLDLGGWAMPGFPPWRAAGSALVAQTEAPPKADGRRFDPGEGPNRVQREDGAHSRPIARPRPGLLLALAPPRPPVAVITVQDYDGASSGRRAEAQLPDPDPTPTATDGRRGASSLGGRSATSP